MSWVTPVARQAYRTATQNRKPGIRMPKIGALRELEIPHRMIENDTRLVAEADRLDGVVVDADVAGIDAGAGAVDEAADVLRDTLIGVVGRDALAGELLRRLFCRMVGGVGESASL